MKKNVYPSILTCYSLCHFVVTDKKESAETTPTDEVKPAFIKSKWEEVDETQLASQGNKTLFVYNSKLESVTCFVLNCRPKLIIIGLRFI